MDEERLPRKILEWCPAGRTRKGSPRYLWMQEIITGMREKGINSMEFILLNIMFHPPMGKFQLELKLELHLFSSFTIVLFK